MGFCECILLIWFCLHKLIESLKLQFDFLKNLLHIFDKNCQLVSKFIGTVIAHASNGVDGDWKWAERGLLWKGAKWIPSE